MPQNLHGDFYRQPLTPLARRLRGDASDAERALWRLLRQRPMGAKFRRQHPMLHYILDFYCLEHRLAVEADGSQHLTEAGRAADEQRTRELNERGIRVLRFSDREILLEGSAVISTIEQALGGA